MQGLGWYFHRLRSMDRAEIGWRLAAAAGSALDLVRTPLDLYPRVGSADDFARRSQAPGFRCQDLPATDAAADDPSIDIDFLLAQADAALQNKLSYFDLRDRFHEDPIDWHRDFSSGKRGPIRHITHTDYRDFDRMGDCKLVWEPNRHHQMVVLARAWRVTRERRYAEKVRDLMLSWITANPFLRGMNWKSPLEQGIRLINWVWALDFIRDAEVFDDATWAQVIATFYRMAWDTRRRFSRGSSANNHLIGEAAGVYVAASYLPGMPGAADWKTASKQILEQQIEAQTFADGCTREHAFGYQLFVIQFFTICRIVASRVGDPFSTGYDERLHRMYAFMADLCADTARPPNMGDADDGYVLDLGNRPDNPAGLLGVGAHIFNDSSLSVGGPSETCWWYFGASGNDKPAASGEPRSSAYRESGYFLMRAPTRSGHAAMTLFVDCAELGYGSIAAHGHADCLSFTLSAGRQEIIVDPGTYDYFSHPEWRAYFRRTRAHNTVVLDGRCQSESLGPFLWGQRAEPSLIDWADDDESSRFVGEHDGYMNLDDPVMHRRSITLDKTNGNVVVEDRLECQGRHTVERYLHLHPDCRATLTSTSAVRLHRDNVEFVLTIDTGHLAIVEAGDNDCLGWVSAGYHRKVASRCIVVTNDLDGDTMTTLHIALQ